jgi:predicted nuclease with TOPRIM domain
MLEEQMQELRELPARVAGVELQIVQLRGEMLEAFSAIRSEFREQVGRLDGRMDRLDGRIDEVRTEMQSNHEELRTEIRDGDQATRDFMRTLFEHYQTNLRTIGEGTKKRKR